MAQPHLDALAVALDTHLGRGRELINDAWQPLMQGTHGGSDTADDVEALQQQLDWELERACEALMLFLELLGASVAMGRFASRWSTASGKMALCLDSGDMEYVSCARFDIIEETFESLVPASAQNVALRAKQEMVKEALESTSKIVKLSKQTPSSEIALQSIIHEHMEATFPGYLRKAAIAASGKYYIPDGALPSLSLAIEWKYVKDKADMKRAIDEVKVDIASYGESRKYTRFFGVFYQISSSICTQTELSRAFGNPNPSWDMILVTAP